MEIIDEETLATKTKLNSDYTLGIARR